MKKPVDPIVSFFDLCRAHQTGDARRLTRATRELATQGIEVILREEWVRRDVARAARLQRRAYAAAEKFRAQADYECGPRCRVAAQRGWQEGSHEGCPSEGGTHEVERPFQGCHPQRPR